jgi:hypothetical protein
LLGDHSVGEIVFKPEGYASHFERDIQNPPGFGVNVSSVWVGRDQARPSKDGSHAAAVAICCRLDSRLWNRKNCGCLKKAPHRTMRQMRRWSVGHDWPPIRHGKSRPIAPQWVGRGASILDDGSQRRIAPATRASGEKCSDRPRQDWSYRRFGDRDSSRSGTAYFALDLMEM